MREARAEDVIAKAMLDNDPVFFDMLTKDERCDVARAILTALSSAGIDCEGWRTIESAPKDGTVILATGPNISRCLNFIRRICGD